MARRSYDKEFKLSGVCKDLGIPDARREALMIFRKLLSIFFSVITVTATASKNNYVFSHEDKEWLCSDYEREAEISFKFEEEIKTFIDPTFIFTRLTIKCQLDSLNRMSHLAKADRWIDFLRKYKKSCGDKNWFDIHEIDQLINNKGIAFSDEKEKDIFYFTLSAYVSNDGTFSSPQINPISPQTYNKFIYHKQIKFNLSTLAHISHSILVGDRLNPIETIENLKAVFKPTMYYPVFSGRDIQDVTRYSYKEVNDVLNIPTIIMCFHIFNKSHKSYKRIPRVLIKKMIEDHMLRCSINTFKDLKAQALTFKNYCDSMENIMPELLREYNKSYFYRNGSEIPDSRSFKKMYATLKKK